MTVAEIIEEQRRKCEADKAARMRPRVEPVKAGAPAAPRMTLADRARAFIEDRTYDGKAPEGDMARILRKENPGEYVARDGTRTFVPWRYVSMQDIELPDSGNPYRPPKEEDKPKPPVDAWGRPSGYGAMDSYDPWEAMGSIPSQQGGTGDGMDSWLAPAPEATQGHGAAQDPWESWVAPAPQAGDAAPGPTPQVDTNGTLDIMRSMRPQ